MQISKIILWPRNEEYHYKCINLLIGKVNYIIDGSDIGKSSIWQIIDYCLCSSKLRVPIGIVRDMVSWYGVILKNDEEEILIARKNISIEGNRSEYMVLLGAQIKIPESPLKNISSEDNVKKILSHHFEAFLNTIESYLLEEIEDQKVGKFSYRDLFMLNHLMHYALVNPSSFVSDSNYMSVIKIKKLLPIILYSKGKGLYKIKKGLQTKVEIQLQTISGELAYLKERMKNLYVESQALGMVDNYIKPIDYPDRTAESYRKDLENILVKNRYLLSDFSEMSVVTEDSFIEKQIFALGKIDECLKFSNIIDKVKELGYKYSILNNEIRSVDVNSLNNLKDDDVLELSTIIQLYSKKMELDFLDYTPIFDEREAILKFQTKQREDVFLYQLGNAQNFVGYNIATFLSFHEIFIKYNRKFVFPFLIIDHPFSIGQKTEDSPKAKALFSALDMAVERMSGKFQVVVLEKKAPMFDFSHSNSEIIENWTTLDNDGLIPKSWKMVSNEARQ